MTIEQMRKAAARLLPPHMIPGTLRYIENGVPMGGFGTAIFSGDLAKAVRRADSTNLQAMDDWAEFLRNYAPALCHGSPENVKAWIAAGGWHGLSSTDEEDGA